MKPNFEKMSVPDLRAYVLEHRDDIEAIRVLFHHPTLKWQTMPPLCTPEGVPIQENISIAEEALKQRIERENKKIKTKIFKVKNTRREAMPTAQTKTVQERLNCSSAADDFVEFVL